MLEPFISLECFEPSGTSLDFGHEDLLGHTLIIGGTGSGKTTRLIYPMLNRLISQSEEKVSLCVLDTKADGSMQSVLKTACRDAGRSDDLIVIDGSSTCCFDLFGSSARLSLEGVDILASLLGSSIPQDDRNQYWQQTFEALLRQALRLFVLRPEESHDYASLIRHLLRYLLLHQPRDHEFTRQIDRLKQMKASKPEATQIIFEEIIATHQMWYALEHRSRSILQSMAASLVSPMNSPQAHAYFTGNKRCSLNESMRAGKIVLVSIDAIRHAELARLLTRIVKGFFYDAVLSRSRAHTEPLAFIIMDDWPLAVTSGTGNRYSDTEALAMIRSRRGAVIAATQSLSALDVLIGRLSRGAALANFSNLVFFRSRDPEVDALAATYMGQKSDILVDHTRSDRSSSKNKQVEHPIRIEREIRVPVVPPGTLARLPTGDAFAIIGSEVYSQSMCLVPTFSQIPTKDNNHER